MTSLKAVVFDVDGVLINSKCEKGEFYWKKNIKEDLGIDKQQVKSFFKNYWPRVGAGELDTLTALNEFLLSINSQIKPIDFMSYWHENDSNINEPMIEVVKKIKSKGFDLYMGTNQEKYRSKHLWEKLKFNQYFKKIFASFEVGYEKPSLKFFSYIESELDLKPSELFFIDDSKSNVEAAISRGWHGLHHESNNITFSSSFIGSF